MTHEELVQKAIEQLKENNKIPSNVLESPHVRDAAVVYFKFRRSDTNCMLVLDSQTGELITAHFGPEPLLREYMRSNE